MKIGDEVYIHGFVDEIRQNVVIIRNDGGYFGTVEEEITNTCGDAISKERLMRELNAQMAVGAIKRQIALDMITHLLPLPVTPQQRSGRWIDSHIPESTLCECSECGFTCGAYSFNYCPDCGKKMEVSGCTKNI